MSLAPALQVIALALQVIALQVIALVLAHWDMTMTQLGTTSGITGCPKLCDCAMAIAAQIHVHVHARPLLACGKLNDTTNQEICTVHVEGFDYMQDKTQEKISDRKKFEATIVYIYIVQK